MPDEVRPDDDEYYETRLELLSQGDIFRDVPLAYPSPAREIVEEESAAGRRFLSGPFETGLAMLTTPTCSMRSQTDPSAYANPVRTLVPVMPLDDGLKRSLGLDAAKLGLLRKYDRLINYMYLPAAPAYGLPESLVFLYMPVTLHHDLIDGQQLALQGARQLHRKLVWFASGLLLPRETFEPPMD